MCHKNNMCSVKENDILLENIRETNNELLVSLGELNDKLGNKLDEQRLLATRLKDTIELLTN